MALRQIASRVLRGSRIIRRNRRRVVATAAGRVIEALEGRVMLAGVPIQIDPVGQWGGAMNAVRVVGDDAYIGHGPKLRILNVSDPAQPRDMGAVLLPGETPLGIDVVGNRAYVADGLSGLQIVDVSSASWPVLLGGYDTAGNATGVQVVGSLAYLADGDAGLQIIDVSNPALPQRLGTFGTIGTANDVQVVGRLAYVAAHDTYDSQLARWQGGGLHVIDVSDPGTPVRLGGYRPDYSSYSCYDVEVVGSRAYVAGSGGSAGQGGLEILDVSNPASPARLGGYGAWSGRRVRVAGSLAYYGPVHYSSGAWEGPAWDIIDVGNSEQCVLLGQATGYSLTDLQVVGSRVYMAVPDAGLVIFGVQNPGNVGRLGWFGGGANVEDAQIVGGRAYLADGKGGFLIVDLSNKSSPLRIGGIDINAKGLEVVGSLAYVLTGSDWGHAALSIVDVSDPASPELLGSSSLGGYAGAVQVAGNVAYVASMSSTYGGNGGVYSVDVSDPRSPVASGPYGNSYATGVQVLRSTAYVTWRYSWGTTTGGLQVVDIGDPDAGV